MTETPAQARDRRIYGMYVACGQDVTETAQLVGVSAGAVRSAVRRHAAVLAAR